MYNNEGNALKRERERERERERDMCICTYFLARNPKLRSKIAKSGVQRPKLRKNDLEN